MEQGLPTSPNLGSLDKLTGKAIFFELGSAGGVDLGDIQMHKLDFGVERDKGQWAIDGNVVLAYDDVISVSPVFSIDGKQFHTPMNPLLLMGTRNTDVVQSAASGATFVFTARLGQSFDIGARNVTLTSVTVAAAGRVRDTDFFFEEKTGIIRLPVVAAGIADGVTVTVTFDKPAITRESITAFNKLNREGTLKVFEMDNRSPVPKAEWALPGTMSVESGSDGERAKERKWSVRFAVNGQPTVLRRAA